MSQKVSEQKLSEWWRETLEEHSWKKAFKSELSSHRDERIHKEETPEDTPTVRPWDGTHHPTKHNPQGHDAALVLAPPGAFPPARSLLSPASWRPLFWAQGQSLSTCPSMPPCWTKRKNCIKEGERKKRKGRRQLLRKTRWDPEGPLDSYWKGTSIASHRSKTVLSSPRRRFWQMCSIPRVSLHLAPLSSVSKGFWFTQARADAHPFVSAGAFPPALGAWGWTDLWEQTSKEGGHTTAS